MKGAWYIKRKETAIGVSFMPCGILSSTEALAEKERSATEGTIEMIAYTRHERYLAALRRIS